MDENVNTIRTKTKHSSFWLGRGERVDSMEFDPVGFAQALRGVGNFVQILTGKTYPVQYLQANKTSKASPDYGIMVSADLRNLDATIGTALHESTHLEISTFWTKDDFVNNKVPRYVKDKLRQKYPILQDPQRMKKFLMMSLFGLTNWLEDRRIDAWQYKEAPGYRGYYDEFYKRYWHSANIDYGLKTDFLREENWDSYMFRIVNITNKNTDLTALNGLQQVWDVANLKNIERLKSTDDVLKVAIQLFDIVEANVLTPEEQEQKKQEDEEQQQQQEEEEAQGGQGQGSPDESGTGGEAQKPEEEDENKSIDDVLKEPETQEKQQGNDDNETTENTSESESDESNSEQEPSDSDTGDVDNEDTDNGTGTDSDVEDDNEETDNEETTEGTGTSDDENDDVPDDVDENDTTDETSDTENTNETEEDDETGSGSTDSDTTESDEDNDTNESDETDGDSSNEDTETTDDDTGNENDNSDGTSDSNTDNDDTQSEEEQVSEEEQEQSKPEPPDEEPGSSLNDYLKGEKTPQPESQELSEDQVRRLLKNIKKQVKTLMGEMDKQTISEKNAEKVEQVSQSKTEQTEVGGDVAGKPLGKIDCTVVRNFTQAFVDSDPFGLFDASPDYNCVKQGTELGKKLVKKLTIQQEERVTAFNRKPKGKIDKRRIHAAGYGNEDIFYQIETEISIDTFIYLSIDASGSMSGTKFYNAQVTAIALAYVSERIKGFDVVVTYRFSYTRGRTYERTGGEVPLMLIAYDSRKDDFTKVKKLFPWLNACSVTPEGLCFQAIQKDIIETTRKADVLFINISDGLPWLSYKDRNGYTIEYDGPVAVEHTRREVEHMLKKGIDVLSFFVGNGNHGRTDFERMYGKNSSFIDPTHLGQLAMALNRKFLRRQTI